MYSSVIICPVNNNFSYINFLLIFFQTNSWLLVDLIIKVELKMVIISSNVISFAAFRSWHLKVLYATGFFFIFFLKINIVLKTNQWHEQNFDITFLFFTSPKFLWEYSYFGWSQTTQKFTCVNFIFVRLSSACTRILHWLFPEAQCDSSRQT